MHNDHLTLGGHRGEHEAFSCPVMPSDNSETEQVTALSDEGEPPSCHDLQYIEQRRSFNEKPTTEVMVEYFWLTRHYDEQQTTYDREQNTRALRHARKRRLDALRLYPRKFERALQQQAAEFQVIDNWRHPIQTFGWAFLRYMTGKDSGK